MKSNQQITDWTRARALLAELKSSARRSLAAHVLLGKESDFLKKSLGYAGRGSNRGPEGQFVLTGKTWSQWCKEGLGVDSKTVDRWIICFDAAIERAKRHKKTQPEALRLLQMPAAEMDGGEIDALAACVDRLVDGSTQRDLLFEIGILKDTGRKGGDTSNSSNQNSEGENTVHKTAASLLFGGVIQSYKKFKTGVKAASKKSLLDSIREELSASSRQEGEKLLVKIRDDLSGLVQDVETDLKSLVLILDKQIEELRKSNKTTTKSKR